MMTSSDDFAVVVPTNDSVPALEPESGNLQATPGSAPSPGYLKQIGFTLLNYWLIFHLFAIVICPASSEPSSPLLQSGFRSVSPYLHALYLDHGYHYFAPDPGPSTLVEYSLEFPDGTTKTGRFPNRTIFPRLFYHRHFMLTEFLGNGPEELQPLVERAFARNLCRATGATRVSLVNVLHDPVKIEEFRKGKGLNDPSTFVETPLRTYTIEELRAPMSSEPEKMLDPDRETLIDSGKSP